MIRTKPSNDAYREGWERAFGKDRGRAYRSPCDLLECKGWHGCSKGGCPRQAEADKMQDALETLEEIGEGR